MKKMTKKLLISVFALVFAFIAVGSTTYAWFTLTNKAEVKKFNAQVRAAEGLHIKVDEQHDWYSGIAEYSAKPTVRLEAITYTGATSTNVGFDKFARNYKKISFDETKPAENVDYVKLDVYFKSAVEGFVYLTEEAYIQTIDEHEDLDVNLKFKAPVAYKGVAKGTEVKYNAANAVRMLIIPEGQDGIFFENKENTVDNTLGLQTKDSATKALALFKAKMTNVSEYLEFDGNVTTSELYDEAGETEKIGERVKLVQLKQNNPAGTIDYVDETAGVDNADDWYGHITVFIWVEGWDAECYDALFDDVITTYLSFDLVTA